jgi:hypothetical protein
VTAHLAIEERRALERAGRLIATLERERGGVLANFGGTARGGAGSRAEA